MKTSFALCRCLSVAVLAAAAAVAPARAGSISSIYDMDRMLHEPHPFANQFGTRWRPAPVQPRAQPPMQQTTQPAPAAQAAPAPTAPKPAPAGSGSYRPAKTSARPAAKTAAMHSGGNQPLGGIISEVKIGALAHDQGPTSSNKESGVDTQLEVRFVPPEFFKWIWSPYPHIGADINTSGDTSSVWLGVVWEGQVWKNLFVGWSMGGAYHDGKTDKGTGGTDRKELGCSTLFRLGLNVGWRFDEHHSIDALLDHISNAKICDTNEGLENVGIRYGYKF